jgi:tetratricopeptide (TPR) repeat protein
MFTEAVKFYQMVLDLDPSDMDLAEKVAALKGKQSEMPQSAREPEPAPEIAPVLEVVREEQEPVPAVEDIKLEPRSEEPEKEKTAAPAEPIPFPEVLAGTDNETKPVLEAPQPESRPGEGIPAVIGEVSEKPEPAPDEIKEEKPKAEEPGKPGTATVTLAEIYVQQGFYDKAIDVYRELISADPDNGDYKARMDELLEKAFPEEKPEEDGEKEKGTEPAAKEEPPVQFSEQPVEPLPKTEMPAESAGPAAGPSDLPGGKNEPAPDIFSGMFDRPEQKTAGPKPPEPGEDLTKAFTIDTPGRPASPLPEPITEPAAAPGPAKEAAVDYSALFSDAPKAQEKQPAGSEPARPEAEAGPEKRPEGENTVSSFQSWLSSLQK